MAENALSSPTITFWHVSTPQQKVSCICHLVHRFFQQSKRQLILVPNDQAADYVDKLLWKYPKEAFIPHAIATEPLAAAVVITTSKQNLNNATILINLCAEASSLVNDASQTHELLDATDAKKEELSRQRKVHYEKDGHPVIVQAWTD